MLRRTALAAILLGLMAGAAVADVFDDCRRPPRGVSRLAACGEVVKGTAFNSEQKAAAYRYRGDARLAAGALADAIADFTEALKIAPTMAPALAGRGQGYLLSGAYDQAIADYSAAISQSPGNASFWLERGHVKLARGDADAAIIDLTEAIRLNPKSASAYNNRGLAHRKKGDLDSAFADYASALMINPVYALGYANRGYVEEARGRKAEAIADLRAAIMLDPSITGASDGLKRLGVPDQYAQESAQRILSGKALVEARCATCHAVGPTGVSAKAGAPEFRSLHERHALMALREPLARGIAAPHDEMPKFQLSHAEIDMIVAYINSLAPRR